MRRSWVAFCRDCAYTEVAPSSYLAQTWADQHGQNRGHLVDVMEVAR